MIGHDESAPTGAGALQPTMALEGEPPRKRARPAEDLRRRLQEHTLQRMRTMRDRFTEQLSELYFLQAGGNMMEYGAWRRRPASPALTAFLEARRPAGALAPAPPPADPALDKAKQEAWVARRVAELARAGLWPERRLPRVLEPPRHKTHWDYLLEEMAWLAQDFAHERKWKKQAAKKCARAVQKYFQDKASAAQKAEKAQELQLKKIAAFAAKEIRTFWANVEKIVEWKRVRRVERARKEALDEQLSYMVDRTERYSRQLAAGLGAGAGPQSPPPSDYEPTDDSADDEDTIAEQERAERPDHDAELLALQSEADLPLADLLQRYRDAPPPPPSDSEESDSTDAGSDDAASVTSEPPQSLEALVAEAAAPDAPGDGEAGERRVEAASAAAAALQPTGTTLADTAVATPVPRLLRHSLREYQHVGLHWLATMHQRRLNGILADEMGLGKTIQTIALLAHLALESQDWGPHLVVAPTSVVVNWELEFKKWCPSFKILTYYGTIKERKLKRVGWTKANSFHVCITSYKLVVQDHQSFRRKRWKYLILDEAQNIKNFKSQRWQMLLNFQTERRLLLTGTPLQNSVVELWSLMHFLMPGVFASAAQFREWFAPVAAMDEGAGGGGELLRRLHAVLRPFLLRRLKRDVERQLPRKYEHVLMCRLAKRQRALYDDFMSRAKTKETLAAGNLLSVINVLMQLRKVCNHPDLFEPRAVQSPLQLPALRLAMPALVLAARLPERRELLARLAGDLASLEVAGAGAFAAHRARHLAPPRRLLEELLPPQPAPRAPPAALRLHLRLVPRVLPPVAAALPAPAPRPARATSTKPPAPQPDRGAGAARLEARRRACLRRLAAVNERRCWRLPLYGADLRAAVSAPPPPLPDAMQLTHPYIQLIIDNVRVVTIAARAGAPQLEASAGEGAAAWRARALVLEEQLGRALRPALPPAAHVSFPHPHLLHYDCGKLQRLGWLLRRLRARGHRVLIFTQMTRVLDVLEAFLCRMGLRYLRLDGATRVDRRQALVDRFNNDTRIFAMILSTRSGGVGLNLVGADAVVFYDSDWNPTMDAQAQDRCHRIGQTRDVHVYRLVTAATVEENILRCASRKRALGQRAIDAGRFTTSQLRTVNIKEVFGTAIGTSDDDGGDLDAALAAAEDEVDAEAARAARAEAALDLAEFDDAPPPNKADLEALNAANNNAPPDELTVLMAQLTPIEKYAMRIVENSEAAGAAEQAALDSMRRQLGEWERARSPPAALTYPAARNQEWASGDTVMPMWCPPTPPSGAGDVYCDSWSRALYRAGAASDALLPAPRPAPPAPRRAPPREPALAPPSLFERAARPRARARPAPAPRDAPPAEWAACEDAALRRALRLQRLPPEPPPALAPNWEWLADLVNDVARAYRSPRSCRERHDALLDGARRKHRKPATPRRRRDDDAARPPLPRLDAMRDAAERRRAAPKRRLDDAAARNPKHAALLADHGVHYDSPPTPMEVASRRADRIAREKQKAAAPAPPAPPTPTPVPAPRLLLAPRREAPSALLCRPPLRPHLKILQHAPAQAGVSTSSAGTSGANEALRTLQLQQVSLRRAAPRHPHVVVAQLAPAAAPPTHPAPQHPPPH